jgi:hypothetical protein
MYLTGMKKTVRGLPTIWKRVKCMKIQIAGKNWWWNNTREGFVRC